VLERAANEPAIERLRHEPGDMIQGHRFGRQVPLPIPRRLLLPALPKRVTPALQDMHRAIRRHGRR